MYIGSYIHGNEDAERSFCVQGLRRASRVLWGNWEGWLGFVRGGVLTWACYWVVRSVLHAHNYVYIHVYIHIYRYTDAYTTMRQLTVWSHVKRGCCMAAKLFCSVILLSTDT